MGDQRWRKTADNQGDNKNEGLEKILANADYLLSKPGTCQCGGEYKYIGLGNYKCTECGNIFQNEYAKVRDFVEKNGNRYNIMEIAEETKVSKRVIDLFINEGKFSTVEQVRKCRECGSVITTGTYCSRCSLRKMQENITTTKNIQGVYRENGDMKGKMHTRTKDK